MGLLCETTMSSRPLTKDDPMSSLLNKAIKEALTHFSVCFYRIPPFLVIDAETS